jgi:hypothetical protein
MDRLGSSQLTTQQLADTATFLTPRTMVQTDRVVPVTQPLTPTVLDPQNIDVRYNFEFQYGNHKI